MRMTQVLAAPLPVLARMPRATLYAFALLLAVAFSCGAARAQGAEADVVDPPGRVGSITLLAGPASLVDLQTGSRQNAVLNWPVTAGWRLETTRGGQAEVRIGSTALRMNGDATVDFARLDDHFMQIAVLGGSVSLRVRNREILSELEVLTQRERVVFDDVGRYRIDVDLSPGQTVVSAFAGRARIDASGSTFVVPAGQRGEVSTAPMLRFQLTAAIADRFDDWVAARDARDDAVRSTAYVSRETTGIETLDEYGDWRPVEEYGQVWFPRTVPVGWAPYRYGRWGWVEPWGWSWIDEAPWGFAPFHYGRWIVIGGVWGWIPGIIVPRPIYAPALVAWYSRPGFAVGIGAPVGWFPLGPREVYVPAYRHSPRYLRVVNVNHVTNVNQITIVQTPKYVHHHADRSTWLPGDRFGQPDPVHRGHRPPPSEWRQYIARPQPPANVPNTKRRQAAEPLAAPMSAGRVPTDTAPMVRPPAAVPPAVEPQRAEPPRAQPVAPPRMRTEPRENGDAPNADRADRRYSPRSPLPAAQPQRPVAPERARSHEAASVVVPPPAVEAPSHRGRGEGSPGPRDAQRQTRPIAPQPEAAPPVQIQPAPAPPRESTRSPPRNPQANPERGDDNAADRGQGRAPRQAR